MAFFAGATNVTIHGGEFNDVRGNLTVFDHSRHTTNLASNNTYNNTMLDSHNDNSMTISGRLPPDGQMPRRPAGERKENQTLPPPPPPPRSITSTGGTMINIDSYNVYNTDTRDSNNNNSQNYYQGPPNERRGHNGFQSTSGPNQETNHGLPSNGPRNGQYAPGQMPFQAAFPQRATIAGAFGSRMSMDNASIHSMDPHMQRNFNKLMNFNRTQTAAGVGGANNNPAAVCSSSSNAEENSSMNTDMANLSLDDSSSGALTHPQSYLSPPTSFSRNKSDPQINLRITPPDEMDMEPSNPSTDHLGPYNNAFQQASHSNPSLAPHMNEPAMVNYLLPRDTKQYGNHSSGVSAPINSPPPFTGGPKFNIYNGDVTKHDHRDHQTNLWSFNQENNTIQDSYNNNSETYINTTGKPFEPEGDKKQESSEPNPQGETRKQKNVGEQPPADSNQMVEEESDESDEETSSGKRKKKWYHLNRFSRK